MSEKPPAPSDLADKFMLRLPNGMRDRIKAAAETANRSMNAEIVARLEQSLEPNGPVLTDENTIYMVLDAKGHPLSWPEIYAHVYRLMKAVGAPFTSIHAGIFNAGTTKGLERDREFAALIRWYQRKTREVRAAQQDQL